MRQSLLAAARPAIGGSLRRPGVLTAALCVADALSPAVAVAHGVRGHAGLPVPAWLFAWAAAIVLVVSFVALSVLWSTPRLQDAPARRLWRRPAWLSVPAGAVGLALFAPLLLGGLGGGGPAGAELGPPLTFLV